MRFFLIGRERRAPASIFSPVFISFSPLPARPYPFSPLLRYLSQQRNAFYLRLLLPHGGAAPLPQPRRPPPGWWCPSLGGRRLPSSTHAPFLLVRCHRRLSSPDPRSRLLGGAATRIWPLLLSLGFSTANQRVGGSPAHRRRNYATASRRLPAARHHGGPAGSSARPSLSCVICFVVCLDYLLSCDLF